MFKFPMLTLKQYTYITYHRFRPENGELKILKKYIIYLDRKETQYTAFIKDGQTVSTKLKQYHVNNTCKNFTLV